MVDPLWTAGHGDVHVGGATVVRAPATLDDATRAALVSHATDLLAAGGHVVVDIRHLHPDDAASIDALVALSATARAKGAALALVVPDDAVRAELGAAGVTSVHASLDAALGDTAPALHEDRPAHGLPAAGDTQLVATEDLLGRDPHPRA